MLASREELQAKEKINKSLFIFSLLQKKNKMLWGEMPTGRTGRRVSVHSSLTLSVFLRRAQGMLQRGGQLQAALPRWLRVHAPKAGHGGRAAAEAALRCSGQGWVRAGLTQCCSCQGCALCGLAAAGLCALICKYIKPWVCREKREPSACTGA